MKRSRTKRASKAATIRLEPDAQRIVDMHTKETGWSTSKAVNQLILFAFFSGKGNDEWVEAWREMMIRSAAEHSKKMAAEVELAAAAAQRRAAARTLRSPHLAELHLGLDSRKMAR